MPVHALITGIATFLMVVVNGTLSFPPNATLRLVLSPLTRFSVGTNTTISLFLASDGIEGDPLLELDTSASNT